MNDREDYRANTRASDYRHAAESVEPYADADASRTFMNRVYNWMAGGLAVTGIIAWLVFQYMGENVPTRLADGSTTGGSIFWSPGFMLVAILVQFGLVIWLSAGIRKMSPMAAGVSFLVYSAISGITLSPIFFVYTQSAIFAAFFTCAGMFAATSLVGYITKMDLSGIGGFCFMALIGIIIASIVNIFIHSEGLDKIITYVGVFVFIGLTAWDTQKLKQMGGILGSGDAAYSDEFHKYAVLGALTLYLDFINLFLMLLRIFGGNRRG